MLCRCAKRREDKGLNLKNSAEMCSCSLRTCSQAAPSLLFLQGFSVLEEEGGGRRRGSPLAERPLKMTA